MKILLLYIFTTSLFAQQNINYEIWKKNFKKTLNSKYSIDIKTLNIIFKNNYFLEKIIKKDKNQLHRKISLDKYLKLIVSKQRIQKGKYKYNKYQNIIEEVSKYYKVPQEVIVALWGVESYYGKIQGKELVIDSLLTLIYDGRRAKFFTKELIHTINILKNNNLKKEEIKGSWAGAMGACQFMPSSYIEYAQDWDKDGKKDIWNNNSDIFASIANYLNRHKFRYKEPIALEIFKIKSIPKEELSLNKFEKNYKIKYKDNKTASQYSKNIKGIIKKYKQRYFIVFHNMKVIKKWNNSDFFALSVAILGSNIKNN
jgi:membrane-bound lytic murein transglycosylase B